MNTVTNCYQPRSEKPFGHHHRQPLQEEKLLGFILAPQHTRVSHCSNLSSHSTLSVLLKHTTHAKHYQEIPKISASIKNCLTSWKQHVCFILLKQQTKTSTRETSILQHRYLQESEQNRSGCSVRPSRAVHSEILRSRWANLRLGDGADLLYRDASIGLLTLF